MNSNSLLISLFLLAVLIFSFFSWLIIKTLKEGKAALEEMGKDTK